MNINKSTFPRYKYSVLAIAAIPCIGIACNLTGTEEAEKPNILFCIADDASYPHMSAYGCTWVKTPGFDRVANEGILFTNAYTPNAKCAPSRSSILTGRNSWQLEEAANHICYFPEKFKTYPEALSENGYFVGATGKGWAPGVEGSINGVKRELAGHAWKNLKLTPPTKSIANDDYAGNFEEFINERPKDQPFCFWYGGREPHRAYEFASSITKGGRQISDIDKVPGYWPDNDTVKTDMLDYAYEIEYFDSHLLRMIDILEKNGLLENTIIVVTADNGMPFPRAKGQQYEISSHLPLAIMWGKGIKKPSVVNDYVSFIDFAPTFLEVAGLTAEKAGMQAVTGTSLTDIFSAKRNKKGSVKRDFVLIGQERHDIGRPHDQGYPIRGYVKDGFLYLKNFKTSLWPVGNPESGYPNTDGSPTKTVILDMYGNPAFMEFWEMSFGKRPSDELYNINEDPECLVNLVDSATFQNTLIKMRDEMTEKLIAQEDPRILGNGDIFDQYKVTENVGYYERRLAGENIRLGWINASDADTVNFKFTKD